MRFLFLLAFSALMALAISAPAEEGQTVEDGASAANLKSRIENILYKIIESQKNSWFPPLRYLEELRNLMTLAKDFNINLEDILNEKLNQVDGHTREYVCKIMNTIFNLKDIAICKNKTNSAA